MGRLPGCCVSGWRAWRRYGVCFGLVNARCFAIIFQIQLYASLHVAAVFCRKRLWLVAWSRQAATIEADSRSIGCRVAKRWAGWRPVVVAIEYTALSCSFIPFCSWTRIVVSLMQALGLQVLCRITAAGCFPLWDSCMTVAVGGGDDLMTRRKIC